MRILVTVVSIAVSFLSAQPSKSDASMFDFWIGEWDLTWTDPDGSIGTGMNSITKILDGTVIREEFTGLTGQNKGFKGISVSVLDSRSGRWKQTWVDNQNAYIPLTGGADGDERYFENEFMQNGKPVKTKMVFRKITRDSFIWDWKRSTDGGAAWTVQWSINYKRR